VELWSIDDRQAAMTTITKVKIGFVIAGLIAFAIGVRLNDARWRYAAIGCIAIAWVMRFVKPRVQEPNES
jgi:hypothetical protein